MTNTENYLRTKWRGYLGVPFEYLDEEIGFHLGERKVPSAYKSVEKPHRFTYISFEYVSFLVEANSHLR